jgi:ketosteroid isomerase-like protein
MKHLLALCCLISFFSCSPQKEDHEELKPEQSSDHRKEAIDQIFEAEKSFARMAAKKGADSAFLYFAATDAVLNRGNDVVKGKDSIIAYFQSRNYTDIQLKWEPEFVDASASGDLGYTYGPFTFNAKDKDGKEIKSSGVFHTVWKKQADGSWKFVWD